MDSVSIEMKLHILSFLSPKELFRYSCISKEWNMLTKDRYVWKNKCKKYIIGKYTKKIFKRSNKTYRDFFIWTNTISPVKDIKNINIDKIQDYAAKIKYDVLKREYYYSYLIDFHPSYKEAYGYYAFFISNNKKYDGNYNRWKLANKLFNLSFNKSDANSHSFFLYMYIEFCKKFDIEKANELFKELLTLYPSNPLFISSYLKFITEYRQNYTFLEKAYPSVIQKYGRPIFYTQYAHFMSRYLNIINDAVIYNYVYGAKIDPYNIIYLMHFMAKKLNDSISANALLEQSPLYELANNIPIIGHPYVFQKGLITETKTYGHIALAYEEIGYYDESEKYYKKFIEIDNKNYDDCTYANYAEFLHHIKEKHDEALELYNKILNYCYGADPIVEVSICALHLSQNRSGYIFQLENLLDQPHIQGNLLAYTYGLIIHYIHSQDRNILKKIKYQLVIKKVKVELLVLFHANLKSIKEKNKYIKLLTEVYNNQHTIKVLDDWNEWKSITFSDTSYRSPKIEDIDL